MPDPVFAQPERRSFLLPAILALSALALAIGLAIHFFPATTVNIDLLHTDLLPTETTFKGSSVVGLSETHSVLYVASTVRVDNQLRVPIFLDDFHITLTGMDGAEATVSAAGQRDLPDLETNFPKLTPLVAQPLLRNTTIEPGKTAEGTLLFALNFPQSSWDQRKSAVIKVDVYHQPAVYVTIPKP